MKKRSKVHSNRKNLQKPHGKGKYWGIDNTEIGKEETLIEETLTEKNELDETQT